VLTQFTDIEGRPVLANYIPIKGIYAAGRLDMDSEGLLFLTNDGALNHQISNPKTHVEKVYYVQIEGQPTEIDLNRLRQGLTIKNYRTLPCKAEVIPDPALASSGKNVTPHDETTWLRISLREGKKRQIRHMTAAIGFPTLRLIRVAIGPLSIAGLESGLWRYVNDDEINLLWRNAYS